MNVLAARGIPYRNEHQVQDLTAEPAARLIVDYLACLYGQREPSAWTRLTNQLVPFADDEVQATARQDILKFLSEQRRKVAVAGCVDLPYIGWWEAVKDFLRHLGMVTLKALSPDYESGKRLLEILRDTRKRIEESLKSEPDLLKALKRLSDDQAVRILTIHKSKGLEFDSVIMLAVEKEIFFGDQEANRSAFFVGVSRAKRRLILTFASQRKRPVGHTGRWSEFRNRQAEYFGYITPFINS